MASAKIARQRPLNSPNIFHTVVRAGQRGAAQGRPQINSYAPPAPQAVVPGVLMQFVAEFIELPMAPPSSRAAMAMPVPTMARISAYSAAEAPDSSFSILIKVFIISPSLGLHRAFARKLAGANEESGGTPTAARSRIRKTKPPLGAVELPPKAARLT